MESTNDTTKQELNDSQNIILLFVFFDNIDYEKISQIPKTLLNDLVSLIGGVFGLFLGMSCLSFIEIADFIIETFFIISESFKLNSVKAN